MNKTMLAMLPLLRGQKEFCMIHAIGSRDKAEFDKGVHALGLQPADCGVDAREYIYDMPRVMAAADLILCRAGASTLAELCYMGKPVVIVPSPNVTDNHQEKNARVLERAGGAKVLLEGEFDAESFLGTIRALLRDEEQLRGMSSAMASLSVPDATERIADVALSLAGK
jgi:UDP-N-acetylglucosamine--N-acetylmuramyl-(pentapeptide) pyrophosphoryl-undecaprenol N-acetylglucosamine transferase